LITGAAWARVVGTRVDAHEQLGRADEANDQL
jgi:hypothetical protein